MHIKGVYSGGRGRAEYDRAISVNVKQKHLSEEGSHLFIQGLTGLIKS